MTIKTWQERCEELHDDMRIVSHQDINNRMQEEIDDLRVALAESEPTAEPVAYQLLVRDQSNDEHSGWRQYSIFDTRRVVEKFVERNAGHPLEYRIVPLYASPPTRTPMTADEAQALYDRNMDGIDMIREVERHHGIK